MTKDKFFISFKRKHIGNLIIRVITRDNYYVCEECKHIHKRDGKEIRLDTGNLISKPIWYGSIARECFINQQNIVKEKLKECIENQWSGMSNGIFFD